MTKTDKAEYLTKLYPEIRVVLKSIVNMSNLAITSRGVSDPLVYIKKIRASVRSLLKNIDRAQGIADIATGPVKLDNVEFSLDGIFDDLKSQTAQSVKDKGLAIAFHVPQDVPRTLFGDPLRLGQVLLNLTSNAVKFTREGDITVSVAVSEQREENITLEFSVKDTGVGLTDEQQRSLFRTESADDGENQRHLIGLNVVQDLVERMRGKISVESERGTGSVFTFTAVFGRVQSSVLTTTPPLPAFEGMNVLVVDDNKTIRVMMGLMLESLSFKVTTVSSGAEAIAELERTDSTAPYELVFMDWMMPGMDGLETSRRIISHKTLSWHPVIFMVSGYGRNDIRMAAERIGVEGFLEKPVNRSTLQNAIAALFSFKQSGLADGDRSESPVDSGVPGSGY
jgi:two-component system, sensor histidine kinase and response regulator